MNTYTGDIGLLQGKMGFAIMFFMYGRYHNNDIYISFGEDILDEVISGISSQTPYNFSSGLAGIAWGIEFLTHQNFIDCNTNEVCEEIDRDIIKIDIRRMTDKSMETGLEGILLYVLARIKGSMLQDRSHPFDKLYLEDIYNTIININLMKLLPPYVYL